MINAIFSALVPCKPARRRIEKAALNRARAAGEGVNRRRKVRERKRCTAARRRRRGRFERKREYCGSEVSCALSRKVNERERGIEGRGQTIFHPKSQPGESRCWYCQYSGFVSVSRRCQRRLDRVS
jgi:hypothetical protein